VHSCTPTCFSTKAPFLAPCEVVSGSSVPRACNSPRRYIEAIPDIHAGVARPIGKERVHVMWQQQNAIRRLLIFLLPSKILCTTAPVETFSNPCACGAVGAYRPHGGDDFKSLTCRRFDASPVAAHRDNRASIPLARFHSRPTCPRYLYLMGASVLIRTSTAIVPSENVLSSRSLHE
jgi:hypothetical protein